MAMLFASEEDTANFSFFFFCKEKHQAFEHMPTNYEKQVQSKHWMVIWLWTLPYGKQRCRKMKDLDMPLTLTLPYHPGWPPTLESGRPSMLIKGIHNIDSYLGLRTQR